MAGGQIIAYFIVGLMTIGALYIVLRIIYITMKTIFLGMPNSLYRAKIDATKNYKLPNGVKVRGNVHKPYDYWDDAGNGSGVNYVQMPDGSVRID